MTRNSALLSTTAFALLILTTPALAQQAPGAAPAESKLEEVVVTATRQSSTANRVAMSISAVTQKTLDQQGVKSAADLVQTVPALALIAPTADGVGNFAIRGIASTIGAATTGVYLDDTSLTKRAISGGAQHNGAPIPLLFDLDRVEVLKGPQGTLYGGSSEGGTIRFITPQPSLTNVSGFARAEVNSVEHGGTGDEVGIAYGGPLVQDKLGFRVSGVMRDTAGWIDRINAYTGQIYDKDDNRRKEWALRGALKWQVADGLSALLSAYHSDYWSPGGSDSSTIVYAPNGQKAPPGQTYTTPALCFNNSTRAATNGAGPTAVACPTGALPAGWYKRPSYTYGPYNLGDYSTLTPYSPRPEATSTQNDVVDLTLDYQLGQYALKSVTSFIHDRTVGLTDEGYDILRTQPTVESPGHTSFPLWAGDPNYSGVFDAKNIRYGTEQEFRISSPTDQRLSFVGGVFLSSVQTKYDWQVRGDYNADYLLFDGLTASQRYAGQTFATPGVMSELHATTTDTEAAILGEANYKVTSKLKVTLGLRVSQTSFHFQQANYGFYNVGRPLLSSPGSYIDGTIKSTPVTPKFNVQYDFAPDRMAYFTVAKGYRAGGLNSPLNPACAPGLAIYGLTVNDIPTTYQQDSVVSYELGTKLRVLDNRMQLNAAAYQIDWSNIQVAQTVTGCPGWQQNGGTATSKGLDLQIDYRPISGWLVSLSTGYTKANYTQNVLGPVGNGQAVIAFNSGDPIPVPTLQGNLGVRYDFSLGARPTYVRLDYDFVGSYLQGSSFGAVNYSPQTRNVPANSLVNLRGGMTFGKVEVAAFANNVLGTKELTANLFGNGQASCTTAGGVNCTVYGTFNPYVQELYQRPRMVGVQASYRF